MSNLEELNNRRVEMLSGGGEAQIKKQHDKGKYTARERIEMLLDEGTFNEIGCYKSHTCHDFGLEEQVHPGDSVITGYGNIDGRKVFVFAQDFTVLGGSLSRAAGEKICRVMDLAYENGAPVVGLLDSGGARIQEGIDSLVGYGEIFTRNTLYSGVIPQISVVMGPCAGGAVYSPAITDFIFMVKGTGHMFITGPQVIKAVTGEDVTLEELGGSATHGRKSGNCHYVADNEQECLQKVRELLTYLPSSNRHKPAGKIVEEGSALSGDEILAIVPDEPNRGYDMKKVISAVVDNGEMFELQSQYAPNLITAFVRIGGRVAGLLAQQPAYLAGVIDCDASDKGARFVRFCDCFNIPIVTLVDVPGYMPGKQEEYKGIIRHGAKLLYAYAEATVPKISVVIRKAYGGAYIVMSSKSLRGDINYAWPGAEIAVMGPDGAVNIIYRKELESSQDPRELREKLIGEYREKFANPFVGASRGYIDDVIDPRETRLKIINALEALENKTVTNPVKKHGNIPL
ncbi:MAG: acyl-CoA carboxylase subunit beta [Dehalococcoidales bacterium]